MADCQHRFAIILCVLLVAGCDVNVAPPIPLAADDEAPSSGANPSGDLVELDPLLPGYQPISQQLTGRITSVGSDTMNNIMALWVQGFRAYYPLVEVEVEGKGSSTAVPALVEGQATFGPMSRDLKPTEVDQFKEEFGYPPTQLAVGMDMLAVYVNKDNPIESLALPQVDAIFSKTRKLGYSKDISTWGDLGLTDGWQSRAIELYGRNAASGTYGYFKDHALGGGDFKDSVKEQPGSSSVVQGVGSDPSAIGYSGIGYRSADVRALPLAEESGQSAVAAEPKYAYSGEYPLARYLWLTINYRPGAKLDPLRREFIKYILSRQGQEHVQKDGYLPIKAEKARQTLASLGIASP
jgi:phosphate transport system substrate-binding protein